MIPLLRKKTRQGRPKDVISMTSKQQIIMKHLDGKSNRQIAAGMHISRDTVNKYVEEYDKERARLLRDNPDLDSETILADFCEKPKYDASGRTERKVTPEIKEIIRKCLAENEQKRMGGRSKQVMRKKDIHEYLEKLGYKLSYGTVKRVVRKLEERHKEAFIRQEYQPGEVCEFDWGEVKLNIGGSGYTPYQMAVFTAAQSNLRYAVLYHSQDTAAFQQSHVAFFAWCGGVYRTMVYDNMRTAVRRFVGPSEKEATPALLQLSIYYAFQFRFCNVRRGNEKGHVERSVDVVRHKAFSEPDRDCFASLAEANAHLLTTCETLNAKPGSNGQIPAQLFQEEKTRLLPAKVKLDCAVKTENVVDKFSTIVVDGNHYSVPDTLVGRLVSVRTYTDKLTVFCDGVQVAAHTRSFQPNDWTIDIRHFLRTMKRKPGSIAGSTALLQSDAAVKEMFETYYKDNPKAFLDVLPLAYERGTEQVMDALKRLSQLSPGDYSADKVRSLLAQTNAKASADANLPGDTPSHGDSLSEKAHSTLPQYDRLLQLGGGVAI